MPTPLTLISVEFCGLPHEAHSAFRLLSPLIADTIDDIRRRNVPVGELRIGAVLVGRVIVSTMTAADGLRRDLTDPDQYREFPS